MEDTTLRDAEQTSCTPNLLLEEKSGKWSPLSAFREEAAEAESLEPGLRMAPNTWDPKLGTSRKQRLREGTGRWDSWKVVAGENGSWHLHRMGEEVLAHIQVTGWKIAFLRWNNKNRIFFFLAVHVDPFVCPPIPHCPLFHHHLLPYLHQCGLEMCESV